MDWDEPVDKQFRPIRIKEGQLLRIQDVLQEAVNEGKLSKKTFDDVVRYARRGNRPYAGVQKDVGP